YTTNMDGIFKVPLTTGFRYLFYAVTPNETTFEHVEDVPNYVEQVTPFFLLSILLEYAICHVTGSRKMRLHNDGYVSIVQGLCSELPRMLFRSAEVASYIWMYNNWRITELPWNSAFTWWLAFFGVDLGYYWFHRLAHESNFMWAAHQVHHSSEDYNLSTALRQSVLQKYTSWIFYFPMALCIPPPVFMVHKQFNLLYQFWIHTELVGTLGPLEYILNTPSHHRVHHGRNPYCIDKNYAGTLIIWDRMFGTFQAEDEEVVYGLTHPINTWQTWDIQLGHLKYMWGLLCSTPGLSNKLSVIFKGPGWTKEKPNLRLGDPNDLPKVKAPVKAYNTQNPLWTRVYVWVQFFITLGISQEVTIRKMGLSQSTVLLCMIFLFMSLYTSGAILEKRAHGAVLECLRCAVFCGVNMYIVSQRDTVPVILHILQGLFIVFTAVWTVQSIRLLSGTDIFESHQTATNGIQNGIQKPLDKND
ncbi:unnamed protein product, partial [Owenia fusiformis]